jgi:hypothetical protein
VRPSSSSTLVHSVAMAQVDAWWLSMMASAITGTAVLGNTALAHRATQARANFAPDTTTSTAASGVGTG